MNTIQARRAGAAAPADASTTFALDADVIVVGSGAAGCAAALYAARAGASVLMLEKAAAVGGTSARSHAWYWMPGNSWLRRAGLEDSKAGALAYMARLARPHSYRSDDPQLGLAAWEHELLEAFWDDAADTADDLHASGALRAHHTIETPDYFTRLPENGTPYGRALAPATDSGERGFGDALIGQLMAAVVAAGVDVRTGHRVGSALVDDRGEVVGVIARTRESTVAARARRGVVFASGGFAASPDLCRDFLAGPVYGTCAAPENTGDFIAIATSLGATLHNMSFASGTPATFEKVLRGNLDYTNLSLPPGDSMLWVDRHGNRVVNEKAPYNELTQTSWRWDPGRGDFASLLLFMVWDQSCQDRYASIGFRGDNPIAPPGEDRSHIVSAGSWPDLARALAQRLDALSEHTGGFTLDPGFARRLPETVARFNRFAGEGRDPDFQRGDEPINAYFSSFFGPPRPGNEGSPTLFPLAESGPYHATIAVPSTFDTKGGPRTNRDGQVLDGDGVPIGGLYGAGSCVAQASAAGYFGAGATIGPALVFGRRAGAHAAAQPVRPL